MAPSNSPSFPVPLFPAPSPLPPLAGAWHRCGRVDVKTGAKSVTLRNGFCVADRNHGDGEIVFPLRAPRGAAEVQLWAGFRARDRHRRYVVALRGGNNDHLYLARYGPGGEARFLGIAALGFRPEPGAWYRLRVALDGLRIRVFLGDEAAPRLEATDDAQGWTDGALVLGGGYLPAEFGAPEMRPYAAGPTTAVPIPPPGESRGEQEERRRRERASYRGARLDALDDARTEWPLDGAWLFLPEQEVSAQSRPADEGHDDGAWHLLDVPALWTPCLAWLHGESAFPCLKGLSQHKGVSEKAYLAELARLDACTFPWRETEAGWYRHHVVLPEEIAGRKTKLHFEAIAKVSEIWVNGRRVGGHAGMFGEVCCDVSDAVRPGRNVIAVHVRRRPAQGESQSGRVVGLAESVEVTEKMLSTLPVDMYQFDPGGIWQPVKLVVTGPTSVGDLFVRPRLDGAEIEVAIEGGEPPEAVTVAYAIRSRTDGSLLFADDHAAEWMVPTGGGETVRLSTPSLAPRLWHPADPQLYELVVELRQGGRILDRRRVEFGFRTFAVEGNRFLLNGRPYWLRGANHFPHALGPNDRALAERFTQLAVEGNVRAARFHVAPLTKTWAEAADRKGVLVSFEGIWPWLMLQGEPPAPELLKAWEDDFASLVRRYRNHPSVILWTVNNEMKFYIFNAGDKELLRRKWEIVSRMIRRIRELDPTRPVVADSGYVRGAHADDYRDVVLANGLDDGDVDDIHEYYGWYHPSFTTAWKGEFAARSASPDRPFICQELSTGYPRNDDGLPVRFYLFNHHTPQALVGDYAFEHNDPALFLSRLSRITRQLGEAIRRTNRDNAAGALHFAYLTWFRNVHDAASVTPWPPYHALRAALQPVLLSLEHLGHRFHAGAHIRRRLCVVNDAEDGEALPPARLEWKIVDRDKILAEGGKPLAGVPYYANHWTDLEIAFPSVLPRPRVEARLALRLVAGGRVLAEASYDLTLASRTWAQPRPEFPERPSVYDPRGILVPSLPPGSFIPAATLSEALESAVAAVDARGLDVAELARLRDFAGEGGCLLLCHAGEGITSVLPEAVRGYRDVPGEIVNLRLPESPLFDGIDPLDLAWFEDGPGAALACTGVYEPHARGTVSVLADFCDFHNYLPSPADVRAHSGTPLLEARAGAGFVVASEMNFAAGAADPVAARLLNNALLRLAGLASAVGRRRPAFVVEEESVR